MVQVQETVARSGRETNDDSRHTPEAISAEVNGLVKAAFAPTTQIVYETAVHRFDDFRGRHGLPLQWPATTGHIVQFVASLSLEGRAFSTARTYIAGLSTKHKINGWDDPTDNFLLSKLLRVMAKSDPRRDNRLPISWDRLR